LKIYFKIRWDQNGIFSSLNGEAKNVYQQIKDHQEYKEIFIVDECVDALIGRN
jgi:hypothetical protein